MSLSKYKYEAFTRIVLGKGGALIVILFLLMSLIKIAIFNLPKVLFYNQFYNFINGLHVNSNLFKFVWKWSFDLTENPLTDLFNIILLSILLVVLSELGSSGISLWRKVKKYEEADEWAQIRGDNGKSIKNVNVGNNVTNNYHLKDLDVDEKRNPWHKRPEGVLIVTIVAGLLVNFLSKLLFEF